MPDRQLARAGWCGVKEAAMTKHVSRRAVLARAPAAIAAAGTMAVPATASTPGSNDQRLANLFERSQRAWNHYIATRAKADSIWAVPVPAEIAEHLGSGVTTAMRQDDIRARFNGAERERLLRLDAEHFARVYALKKSPEYRRLDAEADAAERKPLEIEDEIVSTPADSYVGISVKLRLLHERLGGVLDDSEPHSEGAHDVVRSIAADVRRLAGGVS